jgi:hypothetical protein
MRAGFVDDMLISSLDKDGAVNTASFAKKWRNPKLQETKAAWLEPETISKIDGALRDAEAVTDLGLDATGKLSSLPKSTTGRSALGANIGSIIGGIFGGATGLALQTGATTVGGAVAGGVLTGKLIQGIISHTQSPKGAVSLTKRLNAILSGAEKATPKVEKLIANFEAARNMAMKNKIAAVLAKEFGEE